MGMQTTIIIRNDGLPEIERNPTDFVNHLLAAINYVADGHGRGLDLPCGNHGNVARVVEVHHADNTTVVACGGSTAQVIGTLYKWSWPNDVAQLEEIIKELRQNASWKQLLAKPWQVYDGKKENGKRAVEEAVVAAIYRKFSADMGRFEEVMKELKWDGLNGCYFFMSSGMYHGVETDGYIHT